MKFFPLRVRLLLVLLALTGQSFPAAAQYGLDLHGRPVRQLAGAGIDYVVLIFAATDCPISNRYVPEVARLSREFSAQGVRIWWVFPNPEDTAALIVRHNRDFAIGEPTLIDRQQTLVHLAQVSVTPEAAVFKVRGSALEEIYRGRIDDRYVAIGEERPQAEHHDLEVAIASALAGKNVPAAAGPPVGCSISFLQK
jgi:AhpC/TSA family